MTNLVEMPTGSALDSDELPWTLVATETEVAPDRGVAALVDGVPVAVFRLAASGDEPEEWYAVSHIDPITGAPVMARGLVGSQCIDGKMVATVASPLHKRRYDLATGRCLDDESPSLSTFEILIIDKRILVR